MWCYRQIIHFRVVTSSHNDIVDYFPRTTRNWVFIKSSVCFSLSRKMLDENHYLIQCIMDYQSKGKTAECTQYQQILHRNLVYLATIADSNQNMQSLLPAPPNPGMNMGGGGMGGSSAAGSLHSQSNLNDSMAPSSLMQSQMSNGPSHTPMQQQQQSGPSTSSMSSGSSFTHSVPSSSSSLGTALYPSSRTNLNIQSSQVSMMHQQGSGPHYSSSGGQHYQGQQTIGMMGQSNQGNSMVPQRPVGSYRPAQQGSQYMGQEEFYGEQYGHTPSSSEPINQQYYPDGHSEYSYQQSSYGEQSYERSFEDSSQHYYEGGNPQYSQQQSQYQQSSGQQQPFNQQQYQSQPGYSSQGQGYGPGQGAPSQYSQYQQGQSQQYSSYRSTQSTPGSQTQRSYTYEQGQYGNYQQ
ncbi:calcium-responsive transactivator-like isoform X1 [Ictalurus furcatus]|uniref:calcium-responsive transactivator-like isoform X1 n=1 Tax=Ictalurus furcatus TaxID=66913 RepID=UPI002350BCFA|nr:calcium-responsive transactivator-like isoform X1 [Ictalurus furcatus]